MSTIELAISHDVTLTRLRMTFDIIHHASFFLTSCLMDSISPLFTFPLLPFSNHLLLVLYTCLTCILDF